MKKLMTRIGQTVFTLGCGLACAIGACYVSAYEFAPVAGWFGGCIMGMLVSGAFDLAEERKAEHKTLSQGYREAA